MPPRGKEAGRRRAGGTAADDRRVNRYFRIRPAGHVVRRRLQTIPTPADREAAFQGAIHRRDRRVQTHRKLQVRRIVDGQAVLAGEGENEAFSRIAIDTDRKAAKVAEKRRGVRRSDASTALVHDQHVANLEPPEVRNEGFVRRQPVESTIRGPVLLVAKAPGRGRRRIENERHSAATSLVAGRQDFIHGDRRSTRTGRLHSRDDGSGLLRHVASDGNQAGDGNAAPRNSDGLPQLDGSEQLREPGLGFVRTDDMNDCTSKTRPVDQSIPPRGPAMQGCPRSTGEII